jgi:hypothetical protein
VPVASGQPVLVLSLNKGYFLCEIFDYPLKQVILILMLSA